MHAAAGAGSDLRVPMEEGDGPAGGAPAAAGVGAGAEGAPPDLSAALEHARAARGCDAARHAALEARVGALERELRDERKEREAAERRRVEETATLRGKGAGRRLD